MNFLIALGLVLLAMLCWTLIVLAIYFALYGRRDTSGDMGLGFMLMAILPWIAPYLAYKHLKAKWRVRRPYKPATVGWAPYCEVWGKTDSPCDNPSCAICVAAKKDRP